jgi:nicotinate-nucleotide adenylyltransferase
MDLKELQTQTGELFRRSFGRTPLNQRLEDIFNEALELRRFVDIGNLREETGDLLSSVLALCHECGIDAADAIKATHDKIQAREHQYKGLGRKVKVALLGGGFDPPTLGHLAVAKFVLDSSKTFDEVWLVPCYQHMYNKELAPTEHRLAMCELMARCDGRIRTFDFEIVNQLRGETYNFVQRLLDEPLAQNECDFSIIIGMDNANTFDRWVNFQELERMIRFVVVPRAGEQRDESVDWYLKPPHLFLRPDSALPETSSTDARALLKRLRSEEEPFKGVLEDDILRLIHPSILAYIERTRLYV